MDLVNKMNDEQYYEVCRGDSSAVLVPKGDLINIIRNGKPLPKGHGRLKDIDKIISDGTSKGFCDWYDEMKYAPTIIEADKEG